MGTPDDGGASGLIGVCAVARAVGLHHTTVSRYVKSHPELNPGGSTPPKIDLAEFRRHHAAATLGACLGKAPKTARMTAPAPAMAMAMPRASSPPTS